MTQTLTFPQQQQNFLVVKAYHKMGKYQKKIWKDSFIFPTS